MTVKFEIFVNKILKIARVFINTLYSIIKVILLNEGPEFLNFIK